MRRARRSSEAVLIPLNLGETSISPRQQERLPPKTSAASRSTIAARSQDFVGQAGKTRDPGVARHFDFSLRTMA